jgi:hypothetical protein
MNSFFERYRQGDRRQVWRELVALGDQVRAEPILSDAYAVATETMARVRKNLEVLVERLRSMGYKFRDPYLALEDPPRDVADKIAIIEDRVGALPLSLRAFYETVGGVDLRGKHPEWRGCEYPDPLVVFSIEAPVYELQEWEQSREEYKRVFGSFRVPIAPHYITKEDAAGGTWYGIALPNAAADAMLLEEWHGVLFVDYLRICFQWAGFPRLARVRSTTTWPVDKLRAGIFDI